MSIESIIVEATSKHKSTFIFLHGFGDTGRGWSTAMASIRPANMKVICPTAPKRPITGNGGLEANSWFDIISFDFDKYLEDEDSIKAASKIIHTIINDEITNGIPADHIVLGGFSQGGGLALYSALTFHEKLAGVIALSCWLPLPDTFPAAKINSDEIPIFQTHGDADKTFAHYFGLNASKHLKTFMKNSEFKTYRGLGHTSSDETFNDIKEKFTKWLN